MPAFGHMAAFSTILSKSPTALIEYISCLSRSANKTLMFTLSSNAPVRSLSPLLAAISRSANTSIGCLSDAIPIRPSGVIACSLAFFDENICLPFRSETQSREATVVGRPRKQEATLNHGSCTSDPDVDWKTIWEKTTGAGHLPFDLQGMCQEGVKTILYLSSTAHEALSNGLSSHFLTATSLGLLASPTPFVTGRAFTLFHNDKIHSDGAVGLAFKENISVRSENSVGLIFPGLQPLTPPLKVTNSMGNLVTSLEHANPAQVLLAAAQKRGIYPAYIKDSDIYLGVLDSDLDSQPSQVYRVTSGDPSRGVISLDSERTLVEGTIVCLYHQEHSEAAKPLLNVKPDAINFLNSSIPAISSIAEFIYKDGEVKVLNGFVGASENGWVLGRGKDVQPWRCTVGSGVAHVSLVPKP